MEEQLVCRCISIVLFVTAQANMLIEKCAEERLLKIKYREGASEIWTDYIVDKVFLISLEFFYFCVLKYNPYYIDKLMFPSLTNPLVR